MPHADLLQELLTWRAGAVAVVVFLVAMAWAAPCRWGLHRLEDWERLRYSGGVRTYYRICLRCGLEFDTRD